MNVSESLWNVDELLDTLEQQENQIDDYRVRIAEYQKIQKKLAEEYQQKISGQDLLIQQMKSESLFMISELKKELQKKSEKIVQLNEKIEKLNKSDKELHEARKLHQEAVQIKKDTEARLTQITEEAGKTKTRYEKLICETHKEKKEYERGLEEVRNQKLRLSEDIKREAEKLTRLARGDLTIKYKVIYATHEVFYLAVLMYGILVTVFKAIGTEKICADTIKCGIAIWNVIMKYWAVIMKLARIISGLCNKIPQQAVGNVLHNGVFVVITAITIMIPFGLTGYGVYQIGRYYRDNLWDRITLAVVLLSIGGVVFFVDMIKVILPVNIVVIVLGLQAVYVGVRKVIEIVRKSRMIMGY